MIRAPAALLAFCGLPPFRDRPLTLDVEAMIESIAAVESGSNARAIGRHGERGRCQFMATTWREYTSAEFLAWAPVDCDLTRKVEKAHLARLCAQLINQGHHLEPAFIAAAWRVGPRFAIRHVRDDKSQRVANLYWERVEKKAAAAVATP